jgi:hypothetical protein
MVERAAVPQDAGVASIVQVEDWRAAKLFHFLLAALAHRDRGPAAYPSEGDDKTDRDHNRRAARQDCSFEADRDQRQDDKNSAECH